MRYNYISALADLVLAHKSTRWSVLCAFVWLGACANSIQYSAKPIEKIAVDDSLFSRQSLSETEALQIKAQLLKLPYPPKYIHYINRVSPIQLEIQCMSTAADKYPSGEVYQMKKTSHGWVISPTERIYWSVAA